MNEFVEQCRREWKRLGVPDPVANEMADELTADLREAEAEGASAEEVVGRGADPRSFATAWAAERGVIQRPPPSGHRLPWRSRVPAAVAAFALVAIAGAVLMFAAPSGPRGLTLPPPEDVVVWPDPTPTAVVIAEERAHAQALAAGLARARALLANQRALVVAADTNGSGDDTRTVGSVLLILGLTGIVLLTLFWLWVGNGRPSRRHTQFDDRPSGPA